MTDGVDTGCECLDSQVDQGHVTWTYHLANKTINSQPSAAVQPLHILPTPLVVFPYLSHGE